MAASLRQRIVGGRRNCFWLAATVVLALDQLTKYLFANPEAGAYKITVVPLFLNLVGHGTNPRGAFSLGPEGATFYIFATFLGLALIGWFFLTAHPNRLPLYVGLGCVGGGAMGNLIDRMILGAVRDFIDLHWMERAHWPIFNIADTGICLGVGLLLWETFRRADKDGPEQATGNPGGGSS